MFFYVHQSYRHDSTHPGLFTNWGALPSSGLPSCKQRIAGWFFFFFFFFFFLKLFPKLFPWWDLNLGPSTRQASALTIRPYCLPLSDIYWSESGTLHRNWTLGRSEAQMLLLLAKRKLNNNVPFPFVNRDEKKLNSDKSAFSLFSFDGERDPYHCTVFYLIRPQKEMSYKHMVTL